MYTYHVFGLKVKSEVPIELAAPADFFDPDVHIRLGSLREVRRELTLDGDERRFLMHEGNAVLHWGSVGTVAVREGREIIVDLKPGADPSQVSAALSGPPLGVLLHQRGQLVLHASGVVVDGRVAGFVGHKGYGKSTTAAALHESGFDLFTDDVLSAQVDDPGAAVAFPGFSHLKLWPSAVEALFPQEDGRAASEKRARPVEAAYQGNPLPVAAIFVLESGDLAATRLGAREAVMEILRNSYASRFVGTDGTPPEHLHRCANFVRHVPVYRLTRRPGLASLPDIVDLIVRTVRRAGEDET